MLRSPGNKMKWSRMASASLNTETNPLPHYNEHYWKINLMKMMSDFLVGNIWISNYVSLHAVIEMRPEMGFLDMHVPDSELNQVLAPFQFKSVNLMSGCWTGIWTGMTGKGIYWTDFNKMGKTRSLSTCLLKVSILWNYLIWHLSWFY